MAAMGHAINEAVSLHRCGCGESYEQWGNRPLLALHARKFALEIQDRNKGKGRTMKEQTEHLRPALSLPPKPRHPDMDQTQDRTPLSRWQKRNCAHPENPKDPSEAPKGALPL